MVITLPSGNTLTLLGIDPDDLTAAIFLFDLGQRPNNFRTDIEPEPSMAR